MSFFFSFVAGLSTSRYNNYSNKIIVIFFKRDKSMEHFHSISRFFIVEKRLFRWFRMFFTLRKNDSFCSPKGSLKGPFQNSSSMELLRKLLFGTFTFNSVLSDMSCQLPTDCLNWIDLCSVFHDAFIPRQLYKEKCPINQI